MPGIEQVAGRLILLAEPRMMTFCLIVLRTAIVFFVAPWPGRMVPASIRASLAILISILITTAFPSSLLISATGPKLVTAVVSEVVYGGALAFAVWVATSAIMLSGQICGLQMGFGLRGQLDPSSGSEMNAISEIAFAAWMPFALEFGLHHQLLRAMSIAPASVSPEGLTLVDRAVLLGQISIGSGQEMFVLALVGAGPVFAMTALSYAGLGAISRAVPNAMIIGEALAGAAVLGMLAVGISSTSWPALARKALLPLLEFLRG